MCYFLGPKDCLTRKRLLIASSLPHPQQCTLVKLIFCFSSGYDFIILEYHDIDHRELANLSTRTSRAAGD
jgi:hypothetical protein